MLTIVAASVLAVAGATSGQVTAPGPQGKLAGTMIDAGRNSPVVLIIPGSGPTDRDGNNPLGVNAASYRRLAEGLATRGISSVRIDKRGMFGSRAAVPDPNAVTIADYAADVHSWVDSIRQRTGRRCVWVLGHSEGGTVALAAAQKPAGICGVISASASGRRFGDTLRAQLRANPANAPILPPALKALDELEAGRRVPLSDLPGPLAGLFAPQVQGYLIDLLAQDSAKFAAALKVPLLVLQGDTDLQTSVEDARLLASAQPQARLVILAGVNHVLKAAPADRAANIATYSHADLPIASGVVDAVADFVKR